MAIKEKRYKYVEDVIEDYLYLVDERIELPLALKKIRDKYETLKEEYQGKVLDKEEAEDFFKLFNQEKKLEERVAEVDAEFSEIEGVLKEFLAYLDGHQITFQKKDEVEKTRITYHFSLENGQIRFSRELTKSQKRNKEVEAHLIHKN